MSVSVCVREKRVSYSLLGCVLGEVSVCYEH